MQRRFETAMRREKDRANAFKAAGDKDAERIAKAKVTTLNQKYAQFSNAAGLSVKTNRVGVAGYTRGGSVTSTLTSGVKSGIVVKSTLIPRVYKSLDAAGSKELQAQSDNVYMAGLTKGSRSTEKGAVDNYTDGGHTQMNPFLYGKSHEPEAVVEKLIEDSALIDSAIGKFALDRDIVVFSGTKAIHYADWEIGDTKTIPAYLSTAAEETYAKTFFNKSAKEGGAVMLEIRVPSGAKGIYIGGNTAYHKGDETEFLLARGTQYRVIERQTRRIILEVLE
jgi:hypothetical protein